MLALVAGISISIWIDGRIAKEFDRICYFESLTGYGMWEETKNDRNMASLSKEVGHSLMAIADLKRRIQLAKSLFAFIVSNNGEHDASSFPAFTLGHHDQQPSETARLLLRQTDAADSTAEYLQERAKNQLSVVS